VTITTRIEGRRERAGRFVMARGHVVGWLVALVAVAVLMIWPSVRLLGVAGEDGLDAALMALGGVSARAVIDTLAVSLAVVLLSVAGGTLVALAIERLPSGRRQRVRWAMLLPLLTPPFVTALGWVRAYGPSALLDDAIGFRLPGLFGVPGIVAVLTVSAVPLAYLVIAAGLATRAEPDAVRAARVHGASAMGAFRTVTLPLLRPSLLAAGVLVFVTSINAFGVPAVLGIPAGFTTITTRIYRDLALSADPVAFQRVVVLAGLLVVIALLLVVPTDYLARGRARTGGSSGTTIAAARSSLLTLGLLLYVAVAAVVPLVALVLTAITRGVGMPPTPQNWTLDNFSEAVSGRTGPALFNTVLLALVAATAVVALGSLAAWLGGRSRGRFLASAVTIGFALPGSAVALGVILAYGGWLRDTLAIILICYLAKFWMLGLRPISGAADRLPADLVRAARVSGASAFVALRTIVAPILRPALGAAWLIVFLFALHELTMSSLLHGPGTATLAVVILDLQQLGDPTVTSALAVLLTVGVLLVAVPVRLSRSLARQLPGWE